MVRCCAIVLGLRIAPSDSGYSPAFLVIGTLLLPKRIADKGPGEFLSKDMQKYSRDEKIR